MSDWVLVPKEPTEAMDEAAIAAFHDPANRHGDVLGEVYRAMLSTAPPPETVGLEPGDMHEINRRIPVMLAERLRSYIDTLLSQADAARRTAWQPLKTAPRDGTVVLVCKQGGEAYAAYWSLARKAVSVGVGDKHYPWVFLDSTNGLNALAEGVNGITHWAPLLKALPAPATRSTEGGT